MWRNKRPGTKENKNSGWQAGKTARRKKEKTKKEKAKKESIHLVIVIFLEKSEIELQKPWLDRQH